MIKCYLFIRNSFGFLDFVCKILSEYMVNWYFLLYCVIFYCKVWLFYLVWGGMKRREELFAIYIIENKCTIRDCAKNFGYGKSTVHLDISKKLIQTNRFLYIQVYKILNKNLRERHIRGGLSTKNKYLSNWVLCKSNKNT